MCYILFNTSEAVKLLPAVAAELCAFEVHFISLVFDLLSDELQGVKCMLIA